LGEKHGFTKSHQIAVNVKAFGGGKKVAQKLEKANIIVNKNLLPFENEKNKDNPSGIRIGFQDVTRRGYKEDDIRYLCDLMVRVIKDTGPPLKIQNHVVALAQKFQTINYGFHSLDEAIRYLEK